MHRRDEHFAPDCVQQVEHILIEHFPGADLLLHHVEARLLYVQGGVHVFVSSGSVRGLRR